MLAELRPTTTDARDLAALLREHQPRLRIICRSLCGPDDDPEDLLQDACLEIIRHIGGYRGEASFVTWATTVIRSQLGRQRRRRRRYATRDQAIEAVRYSTPEFLAHETPDPEHHAHDQRLRAGFADALAELAELDREVLVLRQLYGMTAPEVAAELGLSIAAVKSRLHRARRELRARPALIPFTSCEARIH